MFLSYGLTFLPHFQFHEFLCVRALKMGNISKTPFKWTRSVLSWEKAVFQKKFSAIYQNTENSKLFWQGNISYRKYCQECKQCLLLIKSYVKKIWPFFNSVKLKCLSDLDTVWTIISQSDMILYQSQNTGRRNWKIICKKYKASKVRN